MDSERSSPRIVMFPWLAHGHIFPYLELAKRILKKKNFHIYLCSTAINCSSINQFLHTNMLDHSIQLVELRLQPHPELPPHYHTTKNLPSHLKLTLVKAFQAGKTSFLDILTALKPDLVIYDVFQPWAASLASSVGIPAVHFAPFGAAVTAYIHHHYAVRDNDFPFLELCLEDNEKKILDSLVEFLSANVFDHGGDSFSVNQKLSHEIVLMKASRGLEQKYIEYVSTVSDKRNLSVGPLVTDVDKSEEENLKILQWLSKKDQHSTVYISFGSEFFLCKEEIEEIAKALELCDAVNFIWAIRSPPEEKTNFVEEALPHGFLDRVKERGIVVSEWTPQANILAHLNTGAYVTHCGWRSLSESIYFGVPVIAMPIIHDHHVDVRMLVHAGACVEVPRAGNEVFKGDVIAEAINKVIVEKSGEGLRRRARELSENMRMEEEPEMDEVAEQLWQLCFKNKGE